MTPLEEDRGLHIAVVGGGAAAVAFLTHLADMLDATIAHAMRITVIESAAHVGPGLAYQDDASHLVLNRIAATMSVNADESTMFSSWMRWKSCFRDDMSSAVAGAFPEDYVPRRFFGQYLRDCFAEIRATFARKGVALTVRRGRVQALEKPQGFVVHLVSGELPADVVVLCTGHTRPRDTYGLNGHGRYVHDVYPLNRLLDSLQNQRAVCILGASLTAVDIAVSLHAKGYTGRIDMLSLRGLLPYVRGQDYRPYALQHLTPDALRTLAAQRDRPLSLRDVLRLFRRELHDNGCDWKALLNPRWDIDAETFLDREIEASRARRAWQLVLPAGNVLLHDLWAALGEADKNLFMRRFARAWMACRTPIPMKNALTLQKMMKSGQLRVFGGPATFSGETPDLITVRRGHNVQEHYDWVLNATGSSPHIASADDSPLVWHLIESSMAVPEPRGGIQVEFASGSVVNAATGADPTLRAIGHITSGTYFYVDSLDMISRQCKRIAANLCEHLALRASLEHTRRPTPTPATAV